MDSFSDGKNHIASDGQDRRRWIIIVVGSVIMLGITQLAVRFLHDDRPAIVKQRLFARPGGPISEWLANAVVDERGDVTITDSVTARQEPHVITNGICITTPSEFRDHTGTMQKTSTRILSVLKDHDTLYSINSPDFSRIHHSRDNEVCLGEEKIALAAGKWYTLAGAYTIENLVESVGEGRRALLWQITPIMVAQADRVVGTLQLPNGVLASDISFATPMIFTNYVEFKPDQNKREDLAKARRIPLPKESMHIATSSDGRTIITVTAPNPVVPHDSLAIELEWKTKL